MKHKEIAGVIFAAIGMSLLSGCTAGGGMWMGSPQPPPLEPSTVMILTSPPSWPYKEVGLVQSQGTTLTKDVEVFRGLQMEAAKIGAPAVIVSRDFEDFSATPDSESLLGTPLKGTAISPVKLSPAELSQWHAARAAKRAVRQRPAVQTIGR